MDVERVRDIGTDHARGPGPRPRPPEDDLGSLLRRTAVGDLTAFERVYRELGGPVFGVVRRVLLNEAQSEEVTQEVFLEVWRNCSRFDPSRGSARSWVLMIAHRRAVDRVRSEASATEREAAAGRLEPESTPTDGVEQVVENSLEREKVRRCLRRLTSLQKDAVQLTYYTGYTQAEAAALLKVPLTTVKGRLRDGLIRLRDCLGVTA
ncbi:ECF RNA polymerase sigma factor SigK [Nocardiopsis sp. CNT312]|uniref:ECF RNA polymerase sigma factor SigK n=1 Tax=Nocardiopsis sp. CNT312 TaxID=1137268 RepID=UPI00048C2C4B|nr:ECF RNA polymerase sigma factor SigK [Nocardiopsis sp. CNT312]